MANWNKLTESKYNAIKLLLKGGASHAEAAKYMDVSQNTVYSINKSETFEEYNHMKAEYEMRRIKAIKARKEAEARAAEEQRIAEQKAQEAKKAAESVGAVPASQIVKQTEAPAEIVKEIRQTVTVQATHYMESELKKCVELLTGISAKLAFVIDDLCGVKTGVDKDAKPNH